MQYPLTDPISSSIHPTRAGALAAICVAALLLLLYVYRKKRFIAEWVAGWLMLGGTMLVISRGYATPEHARLALGVSHLIGAGMALAFLQAAYTMNGRAFLRRWHALLIVPLALWFGLASMAEGLFPTVSLSGYLLSSIILGWAGWMYVRVSRQRQLLGAALTGISLLFVTFDVIVAILFQHAIQSADLAMPLMIANSLALTFGALGMHLLVFEDMTYEVRGMNRELAAAQSELVRLATSDELTGCHNRRFLEQLIPHEIDRR